MRTQQIDDLLREGETSGGLLTIKAGLLVGSLNVYGWTVGRVDQESVVSHGKINVSTNNSEFTCLSISSLAVVSRSAGCISTKTNVFDSCHKVVYSPRIWYDRARA